MAREFYVDSKTFKLDYFVRYGLIVRNTEFNRRGSFSLVLGGPELIWVLQKMKDFFITKGGNSWVRIFRGPTQILLLRLSQNKGGRFLAMEISNISGKRSGTEKKIMFLEENEAEGWFKLWFALILSLEKPIFRKDEKDVRNYEAFKKQSINSLLPSSSTEGLAMAERILQGSGRVTDDHWRHGTLHGKEEKRRVNEGLGLREFKSKKKTVEGTMVKRSQFFPD